MFLSKFETTINYYMYDKYLSRINYATSSMRYRNAIALILPIFLAISVINTAQISQDPSLTPNSGIFNEEKLVLGASPVSTKIIHDGVISPGEYNDKVLIDATNNFYLYYALNGTTIYFAMVADALGWISVGFGYSSKMQDADIIIGYVDGSGAHVQDNFGTGTISHQADAVQNILSYGGSENSTSTIIEFSRYLDTGDAAEDTVIQLDTTINMIWAVAGADDFTSYHSARGYATATFTTWAPSPPFNLQADPGDSQVTLTWEAAVDGGSAITQYTVYQATTQGGPYTQATTTAGDVLTATITGLTNAQTYYFVVTATNAKGESQYSNEASATPSGTVSEPLNVVATAGSWHVNLTWDPPTSDGGSPITQYNIYRSETSGGPYNKIGSNTSTSYRDTTVTNGITYYYVITAQNAFQEGGYSLEVSATPKGPSPPVTGLSGYLSPSDSMIINWTAPITDGGYPITEYRVYRGTSSGGPYTYIGSNDSALGFEDTTVVLLTTYYYVVTSVNSAGESAYSEELKVRAAKVPFKPENVTVTTGYGYANLTWDEPYDNGFPIYAYYIYRAEASSGPYFVVGSTNKTFYLDQTVSNAETYYYRITAINEQGESSFSDTVIAVIGSVPGKPATLEAMPHDSMVSLSWTVPDIDGGFPIIKYNIYRSINSDSNFTLYADTNQTAINDTEVTNGLLYYYVVTAVNDKGEGPQSPVAVARPGRAPTPPLNVTIKFDDGKITLTWQKPQDTSNYPIIEYRIYRSQYNNESFVYIGSATSTLFVDTNVIYNVQYYYAVTATTTMGESNYSEVKAIYTATVPTPPTNLVGYAWGNNITLIWGEPAFDGGSPVTHYNIYRKAGNETEFTLIANATELTYLDTNLTIKTNYTYVVTCVNSVGESAYSNELTIFVESSHPPGFVDLQKKENTEVLKQAFYTASFFIAAGIVVGTFILVRRISR